jgi:hypothetical protein
LHLNNKALENSIKMFQNEKKYINKALAMMDDG